MEAHYILIIKWCWSVDISERSVINADPIATSFAYYEDVYLLLQINGKTISIILETILLMRDH